jgi:cytidyltransferase-like protein
MMQHFKVVIATGGFDPLHSGHIKYFTEARKLGSMLIVGLNSDDWLARKKGRAFMPFSERAAVVSNLKLVSDVIAFDDSDNSAKDAILTVRQQYPNAEIIFANGGDRTTENIPEMDINDSNITFEFGVGGKDKANSSSWILEEWKSPKTLRPWGYYRVLHSADSTVKVKELIVDPEKSLSMQKHSLRNELWFVAEGQATVWTLTTTEEKLRGIFSKDEQLNVPAGTWHRLENQTNNPVKIIEIQYGENCDEDDITRYTG